MMNWQKLAFLVKQQKVQIRVIFVDGTSTEWSNMFILPSTSYGEVSPFGPFRLADARHIEINPIVQDKPGSLLPTREVDNSEALEYELGKAGIAFKKQEKILTIRL